MVVLRAMRPRGLLKLEGRGCPSGAMSPSTRSHVRTYPGEPVTSIGMARPPAEAARRPARTGETETAAGAAWTAQ